MPTLHETLLDSLRDRGEWYEALVVVALDQTHDLGKAMQMADEAWRHAPEEPEEVDLEEAGEGGVSGDTANINLQTNTLEGTGEIPALPHPLFTGIDRQVDPHMLDAFADLWASLHGPNSLHVLADAIQHGKGEQQDLKEGFEGLEFGGEGSFGVSIPDVLDLMESLSLTGEIELIQHDLLEAGLPQPGQIGISTNPQSKPVVKAPTAKAPTPSRQGVGKADPNHAEHLGKIAQHLGFTGYLTDSVGRKYYFENGRRMTQAEAEQKGLDKGGKVKFQGRRQSKVGKVSQQQSYEIADHMIERMKTTPALAHQITHLASLGKYLAHLEPEQLQALKDKHGLKSNPQVKEQVKEVLQKSLDGDDSWIKELPQALPYEGAEEAEKLRQPREPLSKNTKKDPELRPSEEAPKNLGSMVLQAYAELEPNNPYAHLGIQRASFSDLKEATDKIVGREVPLEEFHNSLNQLRREGKLRLVESGQHGNLGPRDWATAYRPTESQVFVTAERGDNYEEPLQNPKRPKELQNEPGSSESNRPGGKPDVKQPPATGSTVAPETQGPEPASATQGGHSGPQPSGGGTTQGVSREPKQTATEQPEPARQPVTKEEATRRIDRMERFFRAKGQHEVADWMGKLRDHVQKVGTEESLASLGEEAKDTGLWGPSQYEGKAGDMSSFCDAYLNRHGIIPIGSSVGARIGNPNIRTVSSESPAFKGAKELDPYVTGDFAPRDPTFKDKLEEAKHLPGLETSEDVSVVHGSPVTHLTPEVMKSFDAKYGPGKWLVKPYGDEAFAGHGIYFPQRAQQISQEARNEIWASGQHLANYGFEHLRDKDGKIVGIKHKNGDEYHFGTDRYNQIIQGDARHWADRAANSSHNEQATALFDREGKVNGKGYMVQPAFPVVGVTEADRAAGKVIAPGEGRVHIVTRNGKAEVIPHATWLKKGDRYEDMPVVFETEGTRAMAKAAQDAINALPKSERQGQIYAPDIIKTENGYKVVEANPANEVGSSGPLGDNPMTIDAYVSHLTDRDPAHVKFIRKLLSQRVAAGQSLQG